MSKRQIFLLLVLLPAVAGSAAFAVLKRASSQDSGGEVPSHVEPHGAPAEEAPSSGASDAESATPSEMQAPAPPAETATPAQNDSGEAYGPVRLA